MGDSSFVLTARLLLLFTPLILAGCGEWEREGAFPSPDGN